MTSSLPNEPLWPRAGRSGTSGADDVVVELASPRPGTALRRIGRHAASRVRRAARSRPVRAQAPDRLRVARLRERPWRSASAPPATADAAEALDPGEDPPLALVEAVLDVGREDEPAAGRPDAERDRHRVVRFVADRDRDPLHAELLGPRGGPPVQADGRLAGRQPLDLDVAPADAPDAEAEHLGDGLLGRPAAGHRLGPVADVALLASVRTRFEKRAPNRSSAARIRSTLMMSIPSSVVPAGTRPGGRTLAADGSTAGIAAPYSTVTDLARLRGWSTSVPRATAMW